MIPRQGATNQAEVRRHNLSTILSFVHEAGSASRSKLTAITGLNRSTVGDLVAELAELGLVDVLDPSPDDLDPSPRTKRGRPSPIVAPSENVVVLALEIDVDSIAASTISLGGRMVEISRVGRVRDRVSPEETVNDLMEIANPVLDALKPDRRVMGIGVAVVGIVNRETGEVRLAPNLGWQNVPLGDMLAARFTNQVPMVVGNEADLGAVAEHIRGAGRGVDDLIFISGEVGVGGGVIVNGRLLTGSHGYAGEIGHIPIKQEGLVCRCGSVGCWETEVGAEALLRHMGMLPGVRIADQVSEILRAAADGNPEAIQAVRAVGHWLGVGLACLINIFNPSRIVLGGLLGRIYPYSADVAVREIENLGLDMAVHRVDILPSTLGIDAPLIGAAEWALRPVLHDPGIVDNNGIAGTQVSRVSPIPTASSTLVADRVDELPSR